MLAARHRRVVGLLSARLQRVRLRALTSVHRTLLPVGVGHLALSRRHDASQVAVPYGILGFRWSSSGVSGTMVTIDIAVKRSADDRRPASPHRGWFVVAQTLDAPGQ